MKVHDLYGRYDLDDMSMHLLFDCIVEYLNDHAVHVVFRDMEPVIETEVYREDMIRNAGLDKAQEAQGQAHHETCISNGETVFLHEDLEDAGGITGRLYDIIHVGLGHLYQWNCDEKAGLKFYGETAWDIGSRFFLFETPENIEMVKEYEAEASYIAMGNLEKIFKENAFNEKFSKGYKKFFSDYARTDLDYITDYYRTGEVCHFFDDWMQDQGSDTTINITSHMKPVKRDKLPLALLNIR